MQTAYMTFDDLDGLGLDLTSILGTATNAYATVKGAKDAKALAASQARAAEAAAAAERARADAIRAASAPKPYNAMPDLIKWGGIAAGAAVLAIVLKRRMQRRRR